MASEKVKVLPHNFVNKIDTLVETYHGITGRKARQYALVLSDQTNVIANLLERTPSWIISPRLILLQTPPRELVAGS